MAIIRQYFPCAHGLRVTDRRFLHESRPDSVVAQRVTPVSLATIPGLTVLPLCRAWPFTLRGPLRQRLHFLLVIPSAVKSA